MCPLYTGGGGGSRRLAQLELVGVSGRAGVLGGKHPGQTALEGRGWLSVTVLLKGR